MSKADVVYYSMTGHTRTVATAVAAALDAMLVEIRCPRYSPGFFRYLRAGYDSLRGKMAPITLSQPLRTDADVVVLATPIWTSYPAVPLRAFLATTPALPARIGLVMTQGAQSPAEQAITMTQALLPVPLAATLGLRDRDVTAGDYTDAVGRFVADLTGPSD